MELTVDLLSELPKTHKKNKKLNQIHKEMGKKED